MRPATMNPSGRHSGPQRSHFGFGFFVLAASLSLILTFHVAKAGIEVGAGTTSATGGRIVPALSLSLTAASWAVFVSSTGVKNTYYHQSNYQTSAYWLYPGGSLLGGSVSAGFGIGGMFLMRSFQDDGSTTEIRSDDWLAGPAGRIRWSYFDLLYLGIDAIWGLRTLAGALTLNYQDYTCVSVGVMF